MVMRAPTANMYLRCYLRITNVNTEIMAAFTFPLFSSRC